jgi:endo-1,4-beta-xylanase
MPAAYCYAFPVEYYACSIFQQVCRTKVNPMMATIDANHFCRRTALVASTMLLAGAVLSICGHSSIRAEERLSNSLRLASQGLFPIGVGIADDEPKRSVDHELLCSQFSVVTPESCMKMHHVWPSENHWELTQADAFVEFAVKNNLKIVGHCFVWAKDERTPAWIFKDGEKAASRDLLKARMKTYIETMAKRYQGKIDYWDVVNEALSDGNEPIRPSTWLTIYGNDEFIVDAFCFAHDAAPEAMLIYNDYVHEDGPKRKALVQYMKSLRDRDVPVQALGLQGHYEIDRVPYEGIEATLQAMRELGLKVCVSELDIDVIPRAKWWSENGKYRDELAKYDPYHDGCPADVLQRQAEQYGKLFALFCKYSDTVARVSFWNLDDGQSWLNTFPWNRVNHPLLFDRLRQPKPAYFSVIEALQNRGNQK